MRIREMIEKDKNIFDYIHLTNYPIQPSEILWCMFKNKYGNRELTYNTEQDFTIGGLHEVYKSLKVLEIAWQNEIDWNNYMKDNIIVDDHETITKTNTTDVVRNKDNETNTNDVDYVVPFDVVEDVEQKSKIEQDILKEESVEKIIESNEINKTTSKFNKDKYNFLEKTKNCMVVEMMFNDIVNTLTLQSY